MQELNDFETTKLIWHLQDQSRNAQRIADLCAIDLKIVQKCMDVPYTKREQYLENVK